MSQHEAIRLYCKALRMPSLAEVVTETIARAERESWSLETFLSHLLEQLRSELSGKSGASGSA